MVRENSAEELKLLFDLLSGTSKYVHTRCYFVSSMFLDQEYFMGDYFKNTTTEQASFKLS